MNARAMCLAFAAALAACSGRAQPAPLSAVDVDERTGARLSLALAFRDADGARVGLASAFEPGKPVLLTLAWYRCTMLCPLVLHGAAASTRESAAVPGRDYRLLTVSIDPRDGPAEAARMRREIAVGAPHAGAAWAFWTGEGDAIDRLASDLGFRYAWDPGTRQFAHPAVAVLLTPAGRISRYFYGTRIDPGELDAAIAVAAREGTTSALERFVLRCFHYTPALRRYGSAVMAGVRGGGVLVLVAVAGLVVALVARARRREAAR